MGKGRDKRKKVVAKAKAKESAEQRREKQKERELLAASGGILPPTGDDFDDLPAASKAGKKKAAATGSKELTAMIDEIRRKDKAREEVSVVGCPPPSPRLNFSLNLINASEALLFGGEHYDGNPSNTHVFNELFKWDLESNAWFQIHSINTPPPRCSHQCVVFRDSLFLFGGEFCTADKFHHHRDLWRLDLASLAWEEIKARGGPSARSGHRMALWRNSLVVHGGFYEAFRETQWHNDLYLFAIPTHTWRKIEFPATAPVPGARSGHQLVVDGDLLLLNGGYTKLKKLKKTEAKVNRDMWQLHLSPLLKLTSEPSAGSSSSGGGGGASGQATSSSSSSSGSGGGGGGGGGGSGVSWERVPRKGQAPSERSGAVLVLHKRRGIQFGGVHDAAGSLTAESVGFDSSKPTPQQQQANNKQKTQTGGSSGGKAKEKSVFFNDLHAWDFENRRWFELPLVVKANKKNKNQAASASSPGGAGGGCKRRKAKVTLPTAAAAAAAAASTHGDDDEDDESLSDDDDNDGDEIQDANSDGANEGSGHSGNGNANANGGDGGGTGGCVLLHGAGGALCGLRHTVSPSARHEAHAAQAPNEWLSSGGGHGGDFLNPQSSSSPFDWMLEGMGDGWIEQSALFGVCELFPETSVAKEETATVAAKEDSPAASVTSTDTNSEAGRSLSSTANSGPTPATAHATTTTPTVSTVSTTAAGSEAQKPTVSTPRVPLGRLNPAVLVRGHTLVVYGGCLEHRNREWALDDAWSIDLRTRSEWTCLLKGSDVDLSVKAWGGQDDDESDGDDDGGDDEEEDEEDGQEGGSKKSERRRGEGGGGESSDESSSDESDGSSSSDEDEKKIGAKKEKKKKGASKTKLGVREEIEELQSSLGLDDEGTTPLNGEALRDFFARTCGHWSVEALRVSSLPPELLDEKEVRRGAFALAEARFECLRPHLERLDRLERQQKRGEQGGEVGGDFDADDGGGGGGGGAEVRPPASSTTKKGGHGGKQPPGKSKGKSKLSSSARMPIGSPNLVP